MPVPKTPSFLILMTDQQRAIQYFPAAWVQENLVNLNALTSTGLTFTNAITNASRCSPSRGVLNTSLYAPKNTLVDVDGTLPTYWTTLAKFVQNAAPGYQVAYLGKWHMTADFIATSEERPIDPQTATTENSYLVQNYGTPGWDAPDAGTTLGWSSAMPSNKTSANTLGGGPAANDSRIATDAIKFLQRLASTQSFVLVVSLVNPHDTWVDMYSGLMQRAYREFPAAFNALPYSDQFNVSNLPASYRGDDLCTKPCIQKMTRDSYTATYAKNNGITPAPTQLDSKDALLYLQFYAYLTYLADQQLHNIYQVLAGLPQFNDTIVVRLADHGEMGMSHGGSMEKDCNVYAETINIPYIFSNPKMFPTPATCPAQAGLVDIVPTLLGLLGQPPSSSEVQGTDLSALITDPSGTPPTNCSIFTYDDSNPWHIRAIQADAGAVTVNGQPTTSPYKYAVYYLLNNKNVVDTSWLQYELYVPGQDDEIINLQRANTDVQAALHTLLTKRMAAIDTTGPSGGGKVTPDGWPPTPPA